MPTLVPIPPIEINPMRSFGDLLNLAIGLQGYRGNRMELEEAERQRNLRALRENTMAAHGGINPKAISLLEQEGDFEGASQMRGVLEESRLAQQREMTERQKQLEAGYGAAVKQWDYVKGMLDTVTSAPSDQKATRWGYVRDTIADSIPEPFKSRVPVDYDERWVGMASDVLGGGQKKLAQQHDNIKALNEGTKSMKDAALDFVASTDEYEEIPLLKNAMITYGARPEHVAAVDRIVGTGTGRIPQERLDLLQSFFGKAPAAAPTSDTARLAAAKTPEERQAVLRDIRDVAAARQPPAAPGEDLASVVEKYEANPVALAAIPPSEFAKVFPLLSPTAIRAWKAGRDRPTPRERRGYLTTYQREKRAIEERMTGIGAASPEWGSARLQELDEWYEFVAEEPHPSKGQSTTQFTSPPDPEGHGQRWRPLPSQQAPQQPPTRTPDPQKTLPAADADIRKVEEFLEANGWEATNELITQMLNDENVRRELGIQTPRQ